MQRLNRNKLISKPGPQGRLVSFKQSLFGSHCGDGKASTYAGVSNFVDEYTNGGALPSGATIKINQANYPHKTVRGKHGTEANYIDENGYLGIGSVATYRNVFYRSSVLSEITTSISANSKTLQYTDASFFAMLKIQNPDIIVYVLNVYTLSPSVAIQQYENAKTEALAQFGYKPIFYLELGNELNSPGYVTYATSDPGGFDYLTGANKLYAETIYPDTFGAKQYADNAKIVAEYIRSNYPADKIGLCFHATDRWARADGGVTKFNSTTSDYQLWALLLCQYVGDANYDAVIFHPYYTGAYLSQLNASSYPASGLGSSQLLDVAFTDYDEKYWRFMMCVAQELPHRYADDKRLLTPTSKKLWYTEHGVTADPRDPNYRYVSSTLTGQVAGSITDSATTFTGVVSVNDWVVKGDYSVYTHVTTVAANTLGVAADVLVNGDNYLIYDGNMPEEIFKQQCNQQPIMRSLYMASWYISVCESNILNRDNGEVELTCAHWPLRHDTSVYNAHFQSGYLNALGGTLALLNKASDGMTGMSIFMMDDYAIRFYGVGQYNTKLFSPVRAMYFEDGATQRIFIVNVSPNARTVTLPFNSFNYWILDAPDTPANPFKPIIDITYDTIDAMTTGTWASDSFSFPAFSVGVFEKTGGYSSVSNFLMAVT